jgi:hypothetical protein
LAQGFFFTLLYYIVFLQPLLFHHRHKRDRNILLYQSDKKVRQGHLYYSIYLRDIYFSDLSLYGNLYHHDFGQGRILKILSPQHQNIIIEEHALKTYCEKRILFKPQSCILLASITS